jgi:hypothetical protein
MWFAKWFGGRKNEHEDDEPARFSAPHPVQTEKKMARPTAQPVKAKPVVNKQKGFDPYNSGSFDRQNAWERTNLR